MANDPGKLLRRAVVSTAGAALGHVADVYVDPQWGEPRWLVVQRGFLTTSVAFVPADGAQEDDEGRVVVAHTRRQVRAAPRPAGDGELSTEEDAALTRHYGASTWAAAPEPAWLADPTTTSAESLVRAEEELEVEARPRPAQRARLVKRVVTEDVTFTVPLRREVLRLEYEDIDDADAAAVAAGDAREPFGPLPDHEVVLYAEVVEYEKKVVP